MFYLFSLGYYLFIVSMSTINSITTLRYDVKILGLRLESQFRAVGPERVGEYISF